MKGFTTQEQSERLLAAGLDKMTADMGWHLGFRECPDPVRSFKVENFPAWSMGRLWDLLNKSNIYFYEYHTGIPLDEVMESLVNAVERAVKSGSINYTEQ